MYSDLWKFSLSLSCFFLMLLVYQTNAFLLTAISKLYFYLKLWFQGTNIGKETKKKQRKENTELAFKCTKRVIMKDREQIR